MKRSTSCHPLPCLWWRRDHARSLRNHLPCFYTTILSGNTIFVRDLGPVRRNHLWKIPYCSLCFRDLSMQTLPGLHDRFSVEYWTSLFYIPGRNGLQCGPPQYSIFMASLVASFLWKQVCVIVLISDPFQTNSQWIYSEHDLRNHKRFSKLPRWIVGHLNESCYFIIVICCYITFRICSLLLIDKLTERWNHLFATGSWLSKHMNKRTVS